jgi:hypothetical protein
MFRDSEARLEMLGRWQGDGAGRPWCCTRVMASFARRISSVGCEDTA